MTEEKENTARSEVIENEQDAEMHQSGTRGRGAVIAWWLATIPALLIIAGIGGCSYLSLSGIDTTWAIGTSDWIAPPGTTLAGNDIGGRTFEQLTDALNTLPYEFSGLSVWLIESAVCLSIVDGEYTISTVSDEVALSVAPLELGLSIDIECMRGEIGDLNEIAGNMMAVGSRLRLWRNPPSIPVKLAIDRDTARAYLEGAKSVIDCEPIDAAWVPGAREIVPPRDGLSLDIDATLESVPAVLDKLEDILVTLEINRTPPEIGAEAFAEIDIANPLATYTTHFNIWKRNRSTNIEMVAVHFEGVVIQPGEILSFDEITGPRTYAEGYLAAPMYRDGRVEMSPGGGACQVSTTLYNAALLAGLEIVERFPHGRPCGYVPYGRDATIAYGSVDLKFRNTLNHPIILHQEVDRHNNGTITFEIYGHPDDRVYVEIGNSYSWIGRSDNSTSYIVDASLAPGEEVVVDAGTSGIHQRAWRTWCDPEGNELYTEQLSNDRVRPIGALIRHNPLEGAETPPAEIEEVTSPDDKPPSEKPPPEEVPEDELPPGIF